VDDFTVAEVASRLGVHVTRVHQLLDSGELTGRKVSGVWLIRSADVARYASREAAPGRPPGPMRAWGLLDMLAGGRAEWLTASARSQTRRQIALLQGADAPRWRKALRGRSELHRCLAHPSAIIRIDERPGVLATGIRPALERGFNMVALDEGLPTYYVSSDPWVDLSKSLAIQEASADFNLLILVPKVTWPFGERVPDAVIAGDLLEEPEPRAVIAGVERLNQLAGSVL